MISVTNSCESGAGDAALPFWNETLENGTAVMIRPIDTSDAGLERDFIARLSPEARRMRFLGQIGEPSDALIRSLTDLDFSHDMALVATVEHRGVPFEIGVARYATGEDRTVGECAIVVADEWQHRGLGSLLMHRLIDIARSRGLKKLFSVDDPANTKMRQLAAELGFTRDFDPDNPHEVTHNLILG